MRLFALFLIVTILFLDCTTRTKIVTVPPKKRSPLSSGNMVLVEAPYSGIIARDDSSRKSLLHAIERSLDYLNRISPGRKFAYGSTAYTAKEVALSMNLFKRLLNRYRNEREFVEKLEEYFHLFESPFNEKNKVLFTGYYEPIFKGSLKRTKEYSVPVYGPPKDLIALDLGRFRSSLRQRTIIARYDRRGGVVPYYSRREIMFEKALAGRGFEIAWMRDPVDLFFLQIQGSGMLELTNGDRVKLSYNGSNGRGYSSIGKLLVDRGKMELEDVSMKSIRKYLADHPGERDEILSHNESYTFLKLEKKREAPRGNINVPLTPLRSIASDAFVFPKAALGYIETEVPGFDEKWNVAEMKPFSRFVLNQDTGGAIRGAGRVDLFWGNGKSAETAAGAMRSFGKVYFLIAKKDILAQPGRLQ